MPEIGEVEKLTRELRERWVGRKIRSIAEVSSVKADRFVEGVSWSDFTSKVIGYTVTDVKRVAKNILLVMSSGCMWHIHLSSTGWLKQVMNSDGQPGSSFEREFLHSVAPSTYRLSIMLSDGQQWTYADSRTWGKFYLRKGKDPQKDPYLSTFGPDWLVEPEAAGIALLTHRGNRMTKDVLCDQHLTSGVGNYLACEALFLAKVHPHTRWGTLHPNQIASIATSVGKVIDEAMLNDSKDHWRVFKRAGQKCLVNLLHEVAYVKDPGGQRGSYFCPECQGAPIGEPPRRPVGPLTP